MPWSEETDELSERPAGTEQDAALCMTISIDGNVVTYPLPDKDVISIGRAQDSDIQIDHPSVSRNHALIHSGGAYAIEDLGSANGTIVAGRRLSRSESVSLDVGDLVQLGAATGVLQRRLSPPPPSRLAHASAATRVEQACADASRSGRDFALIRIDAGSASPGLIEVVFSRTFRNAADIVASGSPKQHEVLLLDVTRVQARATVRHIVKTFHDAGVEATAGLACYPGDGTTPEQLAAHAWTSLRDARRERTTGAPVREDTPMQALRVLTAQIANSSLSVLIRGETGVGKEVCAESIHQLSPRARHPFLKLNCAAFAPALLESELFGHERGAFTGAVATKRGLLETADGGSIFLDEIGDLPIPLQAKLLRVLEDQAVIRVGGLRPGRVNVRFIAATNSNLEENIRKGAFRQDLYFRLGGVTLSIPPLRDRLDEIEGLARAFAAKALRDLGREDTPIEFSPDAVFALLDYSWPGNIRELRNTIEKAVLVCGSGPVERAHLSLSSAPLPMPGSEAIPANHRPPPHHSAPVSLHDEVAVVERHRIVRALEQCSGNQTRAAKLLKIARGTLHARMDTYGIPRPRKREK